LKKTSILLLVLGLVAVPLSAGATGVAPQPELEAVESTAEEAPLFPVEDCTPQMSQELDLETPAAQPQSTLCSTNCSDGSMVSCMGPPCFVEHGCFVYCGVRVVRCQSPCP
jgi:hypothetical protein